MNTSKIENAKHSNSPLGDRHFKRSLFFLLSLSTLFNFSLFAFRLEYLDFDYSKIQSVSDLCFYRGTQTFFFLNWNLFLAWIPYLIALSLPFLHRKFNSKIIIAGALLCWLLFFPNAPYIVTDFLHLKKRMGIPLWYDLMLFMSFAWTGLILGYVSLLEVQTFLLNFFSKMIVNIGSIAALLLCGFGIYLGRFQRWNSWDIVTQPFSLFADILNILAQPHTLGLAIVLSAFLLLGYFTLNTLTQSER
ncbi:MAG: DUF1361 domain-containing protein [Saprospiraceae bacterium]